AVAALCVLPFAHEGGTMTRNALVLGGGGAIGVSWEIGLLAGLLEEGIDVAGADLIVGTSAGSIVGTQVALGKTTAELIDEQNEPDDGKIGALMAGIDPASVLQLFMRWAGIKEVTQEICAEIGAPLSPPRRQPRSSGSATLKTILRALPGPRGLCF